MKILLSALLVFPLTVLALDADTTGSILDLNISQGPQVDCFDPEISPKCEDINTSFCHNLFAAEGKIQNAQTSINLGKSDRSELSQIEVMGLEDLVRSLPHLPADLQSELDKPMKELSQVLEREKDSKDWYKELAKARENIADKITKVAHKRAEANLRSIKQPTKADRDAERDEQVRILNDLVTKARMESSPRWGRLQEVYEHVKRDMINVINTLPLTPTEKNERIERINKTKLSHPFGIKVGGVIGEIIESDCRHNMINAMYMPFTGNLTVCAGFMNAFQSESVLYFTLAHELAHAFNLSLIQTETSSPRGQRLQNRLLESNANLSCEEFNRLKSEEAVRPDSYQCGRDTYNHFMACLNGHVNSPAETLGQRNMGLIAAALLNTDACSIADKAQGQGYMNPNVFSDRKFASLTSGDYMEYHGPAITGARSMMSPIYRLTQELRCAPQGIPCEMVLNSIGESMILEMSLPPACMANSETGAENEADWYAHKAMILRLRNINDLRERRQDIASSMSLFCGYSYQRPLSDKDHEKLEAERDRLETMMEEDNHSDDHSRLTGVMTGEMADLLQCTNPATNAVHNYQSCRL